MRRYFSSEPGQCGHYCMVSTYGNTWREARVESGHILRQNGEIRGVDTREGLSPRAPSPLYIRGNNANPTQQLLSGCLLAAVCLLHARGGLAEC